MREISDINKIYTERITEVLLWKFNFIRPVNLCSIFYVRHI